MKKPNSAIKMRGLIAALAFAGLSTISYAQNAFSTPDSTFSGSVRVTQPQPVYAGQDAAITGKNFKPGQQVTLERGQTLLSPQPYTVDKDGTFKASISVPANAVVGTHPIVVVVSNPDAALIMDLKVSPQVPLSGQNLFETKTIQPAHGLYQSAYGSASNALFVTASVGRPPIKSANLLKIDPQTLKVQASITPALADERSGLYAVYGVGVDDKHGTVWVTNTRQGSLAVYNQKDLSLVMQFDKGVTPGSRDVVIDANVNKAYISSPSGSNIYVYDTEKREAIGTIAITSNIRYESFKPMSLSLDTASHKLYVVSLSTSEAAVIDTVTDKTEQVLTLPGLKSGSGVSVDSKNARLYVVGQSNDELLIINLKTGNIEHRVGTGANPLNVVFNPKNGLAYVANRGSGTVSVVDGHGKIVANLDIGPFVNHVSVDHKGNVYVTNKAQGEDNSRNDQLTRVSPKP